MRIERVFVLSVLLLLCGIGLFGKTDSASVVALERRISVLEKRLNAFPVKFSGYIQADAVVTQMGEVQVWNPTFSIRRGRLRSSYDNQWGMATFLLDITERGVSLKDAYLGLWIPGMEWLSLRAGVMDQPFGYEIEYSSSSRETPERVLAYRTLFTDQRDLGVQLSLSAPKESWLSRFKLEAGLFAGNALAGEEVKRYGDLNKDFIGRFRYQQTLDGFSFGGIFSYYNGRVALGDNRYAYEVRTINGLPTGVPLQSNTFVASNELYQAPDIRNATARQVRKEYFSVGANLIARSVIGRSHLRAEFLWGRQPGLWAGSRSHSGKGYLGSLESPDADLYLRDFQAAYLYFVQSIGATKHSAVFRFDFYDPNRRLSGSNIQTEGDIAFYSLSLGYLFDLNKHLRLMANYCFNFNERSRSGFLPVGYAREIPDDLLTIRLQYKF